MICFSARSIVAAKFWSYASLSFWRVCQVSACISRERAHTYNVGELGFRNQVLRFSTNKLLLQRDQLWTGGFFVLQLRDFIGYLGLGVTTRLDTTFSVSNLLQDASVVLQVLCIQVLLFTNFGQQHADLVGQVRDGVIVGGLAPVRQLGRNRDPFSASCFVSSNGVVLGLDELEELLGEFRFSHSTESGHGKGVLR